MSSSNHVISIRPRDLIPNPLNADIYDATPTTDLLQSIKDHGIIEPLVASESRVLVSGHRRRLAAIELGLDSVPAILRPVSDEIGEIIAFNTHRKKRWSEVVREARVLMPRAEAAANQRRVEGARRGARIRHGINEKPAQPKKRAIEDVAERLNLSRETLRKLIRIYEAVERCDAPREIAVRLDAGELTVHQAHRYVCRSRTLGRNFEATSDAVHNGTFTWEDRICWTDVWEFYGRRDDGFHDVRADADVVLHGAYGAPPADLFLNIVYHFSTPGDLVVDPFAGRGQVHRIAKSMGRRAWSSDLSPRAGFVNIRNASDGPPPELVEAGLIVMDPPYGRDFSYTSDSEDLSHVDIDSGWTERLAMIVDRWSRCLRRDGKIALVIGNRFDARIGKHFDRSWQIASAVAGRFELVRRVSAPYSPSHFRGHRIDWAERNRILLSRSRDVLVLRPLSGEPAGQR